MKITVVGNSHTVAIKQGWEALREANKTPDYDVEFFAVGGDRLKFFSLREDGFFGPDPFASGSERNLKLTSEAARKLNGTDSVDISNSEAIIAVGVDLYFNALLRTIANVNIAGWYQVDNDGVLISQPTLRGITKGLETQVSSLQGDWSALSDRPLLMLRQPWLSRRFLDAEIGGRPGTRLKKILQEAPEVIGFVKDFSNRAAWMIEQHSPFHVIEQPEQTIDSGIFTKSSFSIGATRLNEEQQPANDVNHANAAYGEIYWETLLRELSKFEGFKQTLSFDLFDASQKDL